MFFKYLPSFLFKLDSLLVVFKQTQILKNSKFKLFNEQLRLCKCKSTNIIYIKNMTFFKQ